MRSKNIIFQKANQAVLIEEPVPELREDEILVRLAVSTISSGTERANLVGNRSVAWNKPEAPEAIFPRRVGYSSAGVVERVGAAVTDLAPGDRVALSWTTYNQYMVLPAARACPLREVSFEDGAVFHIATFPLAAIRKCRLEMGESAIVMGMGILGLTAVQLLRAAGAVPVIAVDPSPEKREKALRCGADYALDPYAPDLAETAKKLTEGGANVGIEVTGVGAGLEGILDCMARFGRVALLGCTRSSDFSIDYYRKVHGPGVTLIGAHTKARPDYDSSNGWWTERDDMRALRNLTEMGRIRLADMVEETHSPREATQVFHRLATEKTFPVVQFDWRTL